MAKKKTHYRQPTVCSHCHQLYTTYRCRCRTAERTQQKRNIGDHSTKRNGSSRAWRGLRLRKLQVSPVCERCDAAGYVKAASEVHHKIPVSVDPSREMDFNNLQSLCKQCHAEIHRGDNDAHNFYSL